MNVIGIGTDICETSRITDMIAKHGDGFVERICTPREIEYCSVRRASTQHYAGRWAAKESILKALGTGWAKGIQWVDLEILNEPGGEPKVTLHGAAREWAKERGIGEVLISISPSDKYAVAFATALAAR